MSEVERQEESEEEEEDDVEDDVLEEMEMQQQQQPRRGRQSVSAEAYGEWNVKKTFDPPFIPKTEDQNERLKACLSRSFMFSALDGAEFNIIIGAMSEVNVGPGEKIINRGDDGDSLYVIEAGSFDCSIKDPETEAEKVVKTCKGGDVFGELALLYNCPRAATVTSTEASVVWSLDRETFNHIVKEGAQNKRNRYDAFLAKVPLLGSMDSYERSQLADALRVENVEDGATIVTQGEVGEKFYIVEEGTLVALKDGIPVMDYAVGDYFGELALINHQTRAATVMAKCPAKLLSIDSTTFKRLLNVNDLVERAAKYT
jgi:cAMP-dependent protein kinase regulator